MNRTHPTLAAAVDTILAAVGDTLKVATPLGLGKPNRLINALYARVKAEPERLSMALYSALSLQRPQGKSELERRFLAPFVARHFGNDYPDLDYLTDRAANRLPANVRIHEFYFSAGSQLGRADGQRHYISQNYTHVARDLAAAGVNLILLQIAKRGDQYSLSTNPDVALDLIDRLAARGKRPYVVGVVHQDMPFLAGDARVDAALFDLLLDDGESHPLFAVPREPVTVAEHALGLHASTLVKDGGTLQIGIGALSDALVNALLLRHQRNDLYQRALAACGCDRQSALVTEFGGTEPFQDGLYGATEMVMDGFMHLRRGGVLKRLVYDDLKLQYLLNSGQLRDPLAADSLDCLLASGALPAQLDAAALSWLQQFGLIDAGVQRHADQLLLPDGQHIGLDLTEPRNANALATHMTGRRLRGGQYLAGAFALGSKPLYDWMNQLHGSDWTGLEMQRVSRINELYGGSETLERVQRRDARFFNTCMMQTLLGAAVSDAFADGQVLSGVGGQYNFVAMAHALQDGRSILLLRATRSSHGKTVSNIVWNYAHTTIPRHLRDIVITEYGIADLRGQSDEEVIKRLLAISDARFQPALALQAKKAGKLDPAFVLPASWRNNTPERLAAALAPLQSLGEFGRFPFGCDFDATEQRLISALSWLKQHTASTGGKLQTLLRSLLPQSPVAETVPCLARMALSSPRSLTEHIQARLLRYALAKTG
ncbi:acetyl-CoA hydrolase [Permianibacter sp. IMCC34836]|uniref:acetyl-CoA hydrolase/transferase C-terminal domain-containing protein n=1 Tax=Permianibacter fluminis TaxID=2738515 RepID=UPI00155474C1|nr:acetyl-CoA hydrolase/transferase C-terminal domain-containing protein [Permianibacter fluminis]NQD37159.1 acetyl-CoA hydrolase [Permianibacter fluminis]